jgi:two-component system OmpR family sensor kinase/two-component system sensor histidine kinase BaeS
MIEPILNPADEDFLRSVNFSILLTSVIVGLLALVLGSLLFRQITSPLRALSQSAQAIADGDLRQRVVIQSKDEIGRVAYSFNRMAESLAQADVQRRNLIADIAHELRTPQVFPALASHARNICPQCGQATENDWRLCAYCGLELRS